MMGLQKGKKNELSMISISILYTSHIRKIRMRDISEIYDISKSTASGYVDNLEKKDMSSVKKVNMINVIFTLNLLKKEKDG
ncbi:hypothetical protein [Methanobacterium petrolearium]|uniref:hypothetical protein n=1 Tax=Methanobacterium petrolearium TaxID=710190 RepID=UPI0030820E76